MSSGCCDHGHPNRVITGSDFKRRHPCSSNTVDTLSRGHVQCVSLSEGRRERKGKERKGKERKGKKKEERRKKKEERRKKKEERRKKKEERRKKKEERRKKKEERRRKEGRRKKEEGRREKGEGRREKEKKGEGRREKGEKGEGRREEGRREKEGMEGKRKAEGGRRSGGAGRKGEREKGRRLLCFELLASGRDVASVGTGGSWNLWIAIVLAQVVLYHLIVKLEMRVSRPPPAAWIWPLIGREGTPGGSMFKTALKQRMRRALQRVRSQVSPSSAPRPATAWEGGRSQTPGRSRGGHSIVRVKWVMLPGNRLDDTSRYMYRTVNGFPGGRTCFPAETELDDEKPFIKWYLFDDFHD